MRVDYERLPVKKSASLVPVGRGFQLQGLLSHLQPRFRRRLCFKALNRKCPPRIPLKQPSTPSFSQDTAKHNACLHPPIARLPPVTKQLVDLKSIVAIHHLRSCERRPISMPVSKRNSKTVRNILLNMALQRKEDRTVQQH